MQKLNAGGIYSVKHKKNGKVYVGSTVNFEKRWREHRRLLRFNRHHSPHLQRAWNLEGEEAFTFNILESVQDAANLKLREQYYLDELRAYNSKFGYNVRRKAQGQPSYGMKLSEEARAKISQANLGNKNALGHRVSAEARLKLSQSHIQRRKEGRYKKGWKPTPEQAIKMSEAHKGQPSAMKGRKHSQETRDKMKEAWKHRKPEAKTTFAGHKHSDDSLAKMRIAWEKRTGDARHAALGYKHTAEARAKMSEAAKKRQPPSEETRRKLSDSHKGKPNAMNGRKQSKETIAKRVRATKETRERRKREAQELK